MHLQDASSPKGQHTQNADLLFFVFWKKSIVAWKYDCFSIVRWLQGIITKITTTTLRGHSLRKVSKWYVTLFPDDGTVNWA